MLADAALGLDDKAGVVKCWYVFARRRRACQILLNEDLTVTPDPTLNPLVTLSPDLLAKMVACSQNQQHAGFVSLPLFLSRLLMQHI